jgi:cob(I)alamin adenosyltransferase
MEGRGRVADTIGAAAGGTTAADLVLEPFVVTSTCSPDRTYNRVVKIYTRTGDGGDTGLFDGTRVSKADPRVATYGDVDELNAWLGLVRAAGADDEIGGMLEQIQRDLFALGARLADPARRIAERVTKAAVGSDDITRLEGWIDHLEAELPPLRRFILAGGSDAGASLHVARTVCRRAERAMVALGADAFEPELLVYVNRLSDLLFVMARAVNRRAGVAETEW